MHFYSYQTAWADPTISNFLKLSSAILLFICPSTHISECLDNVSGACVVDENPPFDVVHLLINDGFTPFDRLRDTACG